MILATTIYSRTEGIDFKKVSWTKNLELTLQKNRGEQW